MIRAIACVWLIAAGGALADDPVVVLQSTTSTQNSGLYDTVLPLAEAALDLDIRVVAVGTGQALRNASRCDADLVLT
ncbi:MAG: sulfate transporter, partial [Pseudomonadota bacterium]